MKYAALLLLACTGCMPKKPVVWGTLSATVIRCDDMTPECEAQTRHREHKLMEKKLIELLSKHFEDKLPLNLQEAAEIAKIEDWLSKHPYD